LYANTAQGSTEEVLTSQYTKLITEHFHSVHSVSEYARMLNVSPEHLNRLVKSQSGVTAHDWIAHILLREAKALLMYTASSVSEITYRLGFHDPSYFTKFFKKHTGATPLHFRKISE
jgi:AraC-like DNA-binding protein